MILVVGEKKQLVSLKALFLHLFFLIVLSVKFSYSFKNQTFVIMRFNQNDFLILDQWFFKNFLLLGCLTLGTPKTLHSYKLENITIKNIISELLGFNNDNNLDFIEHLNTVCKNAILKLQSDRISRFLSPEQHLLVISACMKILLSISRLFGFSATNNYAKNE